MAERIWPRWFIRKFFPSAGLFMLIEARIIKRNKKINSIGTVMYWRILTSLNGESVKI